jgi:hypothetical protein
MYCSEYKRTLLAGFGLNHDLSMPQSFSVSGATIQLISFALQIYLSELLINGDTGGAMDISRTLASSLHTNRSIGV